MWYTTWIGGSVYNTRNLPLVILSFCLDLPQPPHCCPPHSPTLWKLPRDPPMAQEELIFHSGHPPPYYCSFLCPFYWPIHVLCGNNNDVIRVWIFLFRRRKFVLLFSNVGIIVVVTGLSFSVIWRLLIQMCYLYSLLCICLWLYRSLILPLVDLLCWNICLRLYEASFLVFTSTVSVSVYFLFLCILLSRGFYFVVTGIYLWIFLWICRYFYRVVSIYLLCLQLWIFRFFYLAFIISSELSILLLMSLSLSSDFDSLDISILFLMLISSSSSYDSSEFSILSSLSLLLSISSDSESISQIFFPASDVTVDLLWHWLYIFSTPTLALLSPLLSSYSDLYSDSQDIFISDVLFMLPSLFFSFASASSSDSASDFPNISGEISAFIPWFGLRNFGVLGSRV